MPRTLIYMDREKSRGLVFERPAIIPSTPSLRSQLPVYNAPS